MPGGSQSLVVRLQQDELDYWVARCDVLAQGREDGIVRTFTTEVSIVLTDGRGRLGCRQQVASHELTMDIVPVLPGVVRQLACRPGFVLDGRPARETAWVVDTPEETAAMIRLIEQPQRRSPVVLASLGDNEADPRSAAIDAQELARRVLGAAHVAVLRDEQSYALSDRWGKMYSCFHRAVRIYQPGFNAEIQSPYAHPLFLPHAVEAWAEQRSGSFADYLVGTCALAGVRRSGSDKTLPTYATVKQASLKARRASGQAEGTVSDADLLKLAEEEIRIKDGEISDIKQIQSDKEVVYALVQDELEQARSKEYWLNERVKELERRLSEAGEEPDADIEVPTDYDGLKEWSGRHLAGRVFMTGKALRAAKNAEFEDVGLVYKSLLLLGREYRDMRMHGGNSKTSFEQKLHELNISEEPCGQESNLKMQGDEFLVAYDGSKSLLNRHLKNNGNTRDPKRCFRLYFFYDEQKDLVVVGSLPGHLTTWQS